MVSTRLARDIARLRAVAPRRAPVPETPAGLAEAVGLDLDRWQREYLESPSDRRLLLTSRQIGKSTVAAVGGLYDALIEPGALVLIVSPSERQSLEIFRKITGMYRALGLPVAPESERKMGLELLNGSRIEALPGSEKTIRGFSAPRRVIVDEASRVEDETFAGVLPMLATSGGSLDLLSTPAGSRGFFFDAYETGEWASWRVPATDVPHRIPPAFLREMRRTMDARVFAQEFMCEFLDVDDQVFSGDLIDAASGHEVEETGGFAWTA